MGSMTLAELFFIIVFATLIYRLLKPVQLRFEDWLVSVFSTAKRKAKGWVIDVEANAKDKKA